MASNLEELLKAFPGPFRTWVTQQWQKLPAGARDRVDAVLEATPWASKAVLRILNTIHQQYGRTFDTRRLRVVVVGPANAGKSSLVNHLLGRNQASVSPIPGTTTRSQEYEMGPFLVTDTPGADEPDEEQRREDAFQQYLSADLGIIVFDATVGISRTARELYRDLAELNQPHVVLLNKMDLVKGYEYRVQRDAEKRLVTTVVPVSCRTGDNLDKVVKAMVMSDPRVMNHLADMLPGYQRRIAWWIVAGAAGASGAVGWEPMPLADIFPLTFLQAMMVLQVGKVYGAHVTMKRARELVAVFAGGWALRMGFQQVIKLIPGPGNVISAAYAAAGTMAMGAAAIQWFASGQTMLPEEARAVFQRELAHFRRLLTRRPFALRDLDAIADAEAGVEEEELPVTDEIGEPPATIPHPANGTSPAGVSGAGVHPSEPPS
jgi:small GTP-binding protein